MILTILTPLSGLDEWRPAEVFKSMCDQAYSEFEWLIVSDGTVPGVREQAEDLKRQFHKFKIRLIETEAKSKHRCINLAAKEAHGDWVLELDPCLKLVENSLSPLCHALDHQDEKTIGIICPRLNFGGAPEGRIPDDKELRGNLIKMIEKDKALAGCYCLCLRRDMMLETTYPEFEGEDFMPPSLMTYRLSYFGNMKFENIPVGICIEKDKVMPQFYRSAGCLNPASVPPFSDGEAGLQPIVASNPKGWMTFAKDLCSVDEISFARKMEFLMLYWECRKLLFEPIPSRPKDHRTAEQEMLLNTEFMQSFKSTAYIMHKVRGWFGK